MVNLIYLSFKKKIKIVKFIGRYTSPSTSPLPHLTFDPLLPPGGDATTGRGPAAPTHAHPHEHSDADRPPRPLPAVPQFRRLWFRACAHRAGRDPSAASRPTPPPESAAERAGAPGGRRRGGGPDGWGPRRGAGGRRGATAHQVLQFFLWVKASVYWKSHCLQNMIVYSETEIAWHSLCVYIYIYIYIYIMFCLFNEPPSQKANIGYWGYYSGWTQLIKMLNYIK